MGSISIDASRPPVCRATAAVYAVWFYNFLITSAWHEAKDDERNIEWTRALMAAMQPFAAPAVYVNYTSDHGPEMMASIYLPQVHERLVALKKRYDPNNLFRMNMNIVPEAADRAGERRYTTA